MATSNIDTDHVNRCFSTDKRQWHGPPPTRKNDPRILDRWSSEMNYQPINFADKFSLFDAHWQPRVVAEMNDYQFKIVKLRGDFVWHDHKDTDETFIVIDGVLRIDFRDGAVRIGPGEMFVVPKGVEHKPYAEDEVKMLLIEPRGVMNTGDAGGERTAANDVWI
jgi:mannose-6-phosphate isomerase-like protein (cupin superfamily)